MADDAADGRVVAAADAVDLLDEAGRASSPAARSARSARRSRRDRRASRRRRGCWRWRSRMSCPAGGFLLVTIGSNVASNSTGASALDQRLDRLAAAQREAARRPRPRRATAAVNASRDSSMHELARRERVDTGRCGSRPASRSGRWPAGSRRAAPRRAGPAPRAWRAAPGCGGSAGRSRCRGRRARPRRGARRGACRAPAAPRSRRRQYWTTAASPTRSSR